MFRREVSCLLEVAALPAHGNGGVQVELEIARGLDELLQLLDIF